MQPKFGILVCEALRREVLAALEAEGWRDVTMRTFPCDCNRRGHSRDWIEETVRDCDRQYDRWLQICGSCQRIAPMQAGAAAEGKHTRMEGCFGLFLPEILLQHHLREGAYLLTPGWLDNWRRRMKDWGFDQATARDFFRESCRKLVLLDTGVYARSAEQLAALAAYVDRPMEIVPVGLEMLRLKLARQIQVWRESAAQPAVQPAACPDRTPLADYAMVFDMLGQFAGLESESEVARAIFDLFNLICAPGRMAYLPLREGRPGECQVYPASIPPEEMRQALAGLRDDHAWTESGAGFLARLSRERETLGVLLVDGVALPEHRERYLNLALAVLPVLALAVANARNYEQLARVKEAHRLARFTIDHDVEAVFWITPDAHIVDCNAAACRSLGYTRDELLALSVSDIDPADRTEVWSRHWAELREKGSLTFETRYRAKDGRLIAVEITANHFLFEGREYNCAFVRDITERRRVEDRLRQLARAVEESPASIVITNSTGDIEYVNPKFIAVTGYTLAEVLGKNPRVLKSGEKSPEAYRELWQTIAAGKEWRGEFHNKKKSGELYWESASISSVRDASGSVTHYIAVKEDITARKQTEAERDQLIQDLQSALANVKSLSGLLPICAGCKKIRDDKGYWSQVELYVEKHSEAKFSHGLCPECIPKYFPKEDIEASGV